MATRQSKRNQKITRRSGVKDNIAANQTLECDIHEAEESIDLGGEEEQKECMDEHALEEVTHQIALLDCSVLSGCFWSRGDCFNPQPNPKSSPNPIESSRLSLVTQDHPIQRGNFCAHRISFSATPPTILGPPSTVACPDDSPPNTSLPRTTPTTCETLGRPTTQHVVSAAVVHSHQTTIRRTLPSIPPTWVASLVAAKAPHAHLPSWMPPFPSPGIFINQPQRTA